MPSLKDIRKRITSVKNTQKITKAMKMVAAAKLRRAQEAITQARPYAVKLNEVVGSLAGAVDEEAHPLLRPPAEGGKARVIVITSDRGLCGGFNSNLLRRIEEFKREFSAQYSEIDFIVLGRKGQDYFKRRKHTVVEYKTGVLGVGSAFAHARQVADKAMEDFANGEIDHLYVAFAEFSSAIAQVPRIHRVLPLEAESLAQDAQGGEFIFEPDKDQLLEALLPRYVQIQIQRAILDAAASEQGARMTAMDNATRNAKDMIGKLTLKYNRARQAAITTELMEITGGAEALKG